MREHRVDSNHQAVPSAGSVRNGAEEGAALRQGRSRGRWGRWGGVALRALLPLALFSIPLGVVSQARADADADAYRTPLAGEKREVEFLGEKVPIPGMDRSLMRSITLGASLLTPRQGDTTLLPIGAFYYRRIADRYWTRDMVSLFVNELEYDRRLGDMELVTQFENYTIPVRQSEVLDGAEVKGTSLYYGNLLASVGPGWRIPVHPFQVDNDLRVQLVGRVGYFYASRSKYTAPELWTPPDTMLYGARFRARYDGLLRNILELPHRGVAAGLDLDYQHRDRWGADSGVMTVEGRRDFGQVSGHLVAAGGIPGLSERDRLVLAAYGGHTAQNRGDRFNAFRINGASFPSEADDLPRPHYTGIIYDPILAENYATATAGYRRELTFFLYFTVLGSYMWAERATAVAQDRVIFRSKEGAAATVSLDSAFLWDSSLYLAWSWDSGMIRNGQSGSGYTLMWNKLF